MPQSTCLHIQEHESAPIRVVDIPWISVRIGRAAFCEVRLTDDDLADEACRLYRRGRLWHLVPAGGKREGKILVEGKPVDASRPLPYDVPFRIGRYCLTLRQDRAVDPDWGMYPGAVPGQSGWSAPPFEDRRAGRDHSVRADLVVEPQTIVEAPFKSEWRTEGPAQRPAHAAEYPTAASVKDRWETRWRVAGEELKARAQRSAARAEPKRSPFQTGFDSVPLKEHQAPRSQPAIPRRIEPAARTTETTADPARREPGWDVPTFEPSGPVAPAPYPRDEWISEPKPAEVTERPVPSLDADDRGDEAEMADVAELEPNFIAPEVEGPRTGNIDDSWYEMPVVVLPSEVTVTEPRLDLAGPPVRTSRTRPVTEARSIDSGRSKTSSRGRKNADGRRDATKRARLESEPGPETTRPTEPDQDARPAHLPSAQAILASHRTRAHPQMTSVYPVRPTRDAELTHAHGPAQWSMPRWLAGPPAAIFLVTMGLIGGVLSWWWASDAHAVSIMTRRLLSADGRAARGALPDSIAPPDGGWSRTTAQHLAHWAIYLSRSESARPPAAREVAAILDRALQISPLNPTARLARAQLELAEPGSPISPRALGLSRDAVSLSWCARRLLAAGDKEAAIKFFEKALEIATFNDLSRIPAPSFCDDPNVPRYLLPGEERVQEIVRELVSKDEWTFGEWSAAVTPNRAAVLAAARQLKKLGRTEAETLLDLLLDDRPVGDSTAPTLAVTKAMRAEAFALKSRWRESEEQYRLAIDLIDDDTIKRSWWFNLADIELRLDDESQRQTALRSALADASDEISRRATEIQRATSGRPLSRSSGPKAN